MATKTDKDCRTLILKKLFLLEGGATADAEDDATVKDTFDSRMEYLRDNGVGWWADDAIPMQAFDPLAEFMLHWVAPSFRHDAGNQYYGRSLKGEADLREMSNKAAEGAPIRAEYF